MGQSASAELGAPVLLGRDDELAEIERCLASARGGTGLALAVVGEAGIGKTALLDAAQMSAEGMQAVCIRGSEAESEVAWAGLGDPLRPLSGNLPKVPEQQATALRSALALGPPVPAEPLAIFSAALSVLAVSAEERPLLILVDDAHWLDDSSQGVLAFVARRLTQEPIALVAHRPGHAGSAGGRRDSGPDARRSRSSSRSAPPHAERPG